MMMLRKFRSLALVMALVLVFVSCTTFAAKKPIKLVFGHTFAVDHFFTKGDLYFKKLVEKNSKGQILIDFFPACQLGTSSEILQATRTNAQQLTVTSPGELQPIWSKMGTFELPYLFRDDAHLIKVAKKITSLINQNELASKTGLRILNVRIRSPRHLTTKFPVNKIEDIKGIKVRVPENPLFIGFMKAFGTVPTVIPASDTYTGLATGTVDAQENPLSDIYAWKFYEQTKYCALTGHMRPINIMVINDKCWKSLTEKQKKIISNAAAINAEMGIKDAIESEKKYYDLLVKEGMKFTTPDLAPFKERAKTIWSQFGNPDLIKTIEAIK